MKKITTIFLSVICIVASAQNFNWTAQTSGVTTALNDVFFLNNQTGWAVGAGGVILHTTDGGSAWTAQTSGTTDEMRSVFFLDSVTGWALGKDVFNIMLKTTDGGATWTDITQSSIATGTLQDIVFTDTLNGWMISSDSIYKSIDGGLTWSSQTVGTTVTNTSYSALAVTLNGVNTIGTPYVGGKSKSSGTPAHADVFAKSSSSGFDFLPSDQSNFKTSDLNIYSLAFATRFIGFAGGAAGTIYKLDWSQGTNNFGPWDVNLELGTNSTQTIRGLNFPTASNGMFITKDTNTAVNALIYHTSDTGNTWNMMPDTIPGLLHNAMHAPDANTAWVVGLNGAIYKGVNAAIGIGEADLSISTKLFPNPTNGLITLEINSLYKGEVSYTVVDISGREVLNRSLVKQQQNEHFELDMSDISNGIYLLSVVAPNGENTVIRLVKE